MLQIVFRQGPIDRAANTFAEMFVAGQEMELQERRIEAQERIADLRERMFEQELAEFQASQMAQQSAIEILNQAQQTLAAREALPFQRQATDVANQFIQGVTPGIAPPIPEPQAPEGPSLGEVTQAQQALDMPAESRTEIRRQLFPETVGPGQEATQLEGRIDTLKNLFAVQVGERLLRGDMDPNQVAENIGMRGLIGLTVLGGDTEIRAIREDSRQHIASARDFRESMVRQSNEQAGSLLDEANLEGEIPRGLVSRGIQVGFENLSETEQERVAPLRAQMEQARRRQQLGTLAAIEETPTQVVLTSLASAAQQGGDLETAVDFYNRKREIARRQTGLSGTRLPYPEISVEEGGALRFLGFGPNIEDLDVDLPEEIEDLDQSELDAVSARVDQQYAGDVGAALRAARRNAGDSPTPEQQRAIDILEFMRDSIRAGGS